MPSSPSFRPYSYYLEVLGAKGTHSLRLRVGSCHCNRTGGKSGNLPRGQSAQGLEASTLTRMAIALLTRCKQSTHSNGNSIRGGKLQWEGAVMQIKRTQARTTPYTRSKVFSQHSCRRNTGALAAGDMQEPQTLETGRRHNT